MTDEKQVKIWRDELTDLPDSQRDAIIEKLKTTNHKTKNIYYCAIAIEKEKENEI